MMISHVSKKGFAWLIDSCLVTTLASPPKDPHDDDDEDEADNEDNEEENEESRRSSENQTNVDSQRVASVWCYHVARH
jgi:hypothetical protein